MQKVLSVKENKKLYYGIGAVTLGAMMIPKEISIMSNIYVFPSVMAGIFLGVGVMELLMYGKAQNEQKKKKMSMAASK